MKTAMRSLIFGAGVCGSLVASAAPVIVPHSGLLVDASDSPVEASSLPLRFSVYAGAVGGNPLWTSQTCFVSVRAGRFATTIGDACTGPVPLDESVIPPGSVRWIDLTVDGVGLSPRVQLSSVPSAAVAQRSLDTEALRTKLASAGTLNAAENPVDWTQLKGVPVDVAAGGNYAAGAGLQLSGKQFSVASGGIVDGMLAGAISGQKLVAGSVGSLQLADGAVTLSKLAPGLLNGIGKLDADTLDGFDSSAFAPAAIEGKVDAVSAKIGNTGAQTLVDRIAALASSSGSTAALTTLAADVTNIKAQVSSLSYGVAESNPGASCSDILRKNGGRSPGLYWIDPDGVGSQPSQLTYCSMGGDGSLTMPGKSCRDVKQNYGNSPSGLYWIDTDGDGSSPKVQAYCDMTSNGGGWILVMQIRPAQDGTFGYGSSHWTQATTLNDTPPTALSSVNAKYDFYNTFSTLDGQVMIRNKSNGNTTVLSIPGMVGTTLLNRMQQLGGGAPYNNSSGVQLSVVAGAGSPQELMGYPAPSAMCGQMPAKWRINMLTSHSGVRLGNDVATNSQTTNDPSSWSCYDNAGNLSYSGVGGTLESGKQWQDGFGSEALNRYRGGAVGAGSQQGVELYVR